MVYRIGVMFVPMGHFVAHLMRTFELWISPRAAARSTGEDAR